MIGNIIGVVIIAFLIIMMIINIIGTALSCFEDNITRIFFIVGGLIVILEMILHLMHKSNII